MASRTRWKMDGLLGDSGSDLDPFWSSSKRILLMSLKDEQEKYLGDGGCVEEK